MTKTPPLGRYKLPEEPVDPAIVYGMWVMLHYAYDARERKLDMVKYLEEKYAVALAGRKLKSKPTQSTLTVKENKL